MKITKCTYDGPDSEGNIQYDMEASLENASDYDIELIKTSCFIIDEDGILIDGSFDDELDVNIDSKVTESIYIQPPWSLLEQIDTDLTKLKATVNAISFRREPYELGMVDVPQDNKTISVLDKSLDVCGAVKVFGASLNRSKPNDDGEVGLVMKVGVRNLTSDYIERISVKVVVIDQEKVHIEEDTNYVSLAPNSSTLISVDLYDITEDILRKCQIKLSMSTYVPVGSNSAEAIIEKE